ncbi:ABC transporter permease, partial [Streptomyces gibsoniae]
IFSGTAGDTGVPVSQLYVAAMLGAGIMATSFQSLGISIAIERDERQLRRLSSTPMPPAAYFLGKVWLVLVTGVMEAVLLLLVGVGLFDLTLPRDVVSWLTFGWFFLLGTAGCALLGIAISSVPRSGRRAGSVVIMPFLVLQFISG